MSDGSGDIGPDSTGPGGTPVRPIASVEGGAVVDVDTDDAATVEALGGVVKVCPHVERLRVRGYEFDIADGPGELPRGMSVPRDARSTWRHHLVQFVAPPLPEFLAQVADAGAMVHDRVDTYAVSVFADPDVMEAVDALDCVAWTGLFHPAFKLGAGVTDATGELPVAIGVAPTAVDDVKELIAEAGGEVTDVEAGTRGVPQTVRADGCTVVHAVVPATVARRELPHHPDVVFVDRDADMVIDDERSAQIVAEDLDGAAAPNTAPNTGYAGSLAAFGVDGTGVTIGVIDTGIDNHDSPTLHQDLRGRLAFFADQTGGTRTVDGWLDGGGTARGGHGTHVAGIAAGNGATGDVDPEGFVLGQGVAPGAQVGSINYLAASPQPTVASVIQAAATNGSDVNNNSWGTSTPDGYDARCSAIDQLVRDPDPTSAGFEEMCVVFSSGNEGGMPGSMTGPHEAKNVVVVGSSYNSRPGEGFPDDIQGLAQSSSRGPTADGRICPTVVAPGVDVVSALSTIDVNPAAAGIQRNYTVYTDTDGNAHPAHTRLGGTSMAAPHVSGLCALLVEWWRDRTGAMPSAAMLRALLINGAEDIAGGLNWKTVMNPGNPTWVASGANQQFVGLGFTPSQVFGFGSGGVGQAFQQRANVGLINGPGQWSYAAGTDTLTVRTLNGTLPDQLPSPLPATWDQVVALDAAGVANIPNNDQGWGRISAANIMQTAPDSDRGPKIFSDQRTAFTANGQSHRIRVAPVDPTRPMRITLCWTDPPGAALVNDLDLRVNELSSGDVYRGDVANFVNGFTQPGGINDTTNNVECVYIENPSGLYDVDVIAAGITTDARTFVLGSPWQDYAIVIDNAQVPSADPVDIAAVIDRSSSMITLGYADRTAQASSQFVSMLNVDDSIGVVSFGTDARAEYPAGGGSVQTIATTSDREDAANAGANIAFGGTTAMGEGIEMSGSMLARAASGNRAIVLLSDGYDNGSPDAATATAGLDPDIALYSCAMGPASDQVLLEALATATAGKYYFMPTIDDLFEIYNWIRGTVTGTGVIANESSQASKSSVSAFVDGCSRRASFGVAWSDTSVAYTHRRVSRADQVAVRLRAPNGKVLSPTSSIVRTVAGKGYVVFDVDQPAAGSWRVEVETRRSAHLPYTVGGFVESDVVVDLELGTGSTLLPGRPLDIGVVARAGEKVIDDIRGTACVSAPSVGREELLRDVGATIRRRTRTLKGDPIPGHLVDLFNVHRVLERDDDERARRTEECFELMPPKRGTRFEDLLSVRDLLFDVRFEQIAELRRRGFFDRLVREAAGPGLTASYRNTKVGGNYNVRVTVSGVAPECGRFVRHVFGTALIGRPVERRDDG